MGAIPIPLDQIENATPDDDQRRRGIPVDQTPTRAINVPSPEVRARAIPEEAPVISAQQPSPNIPATNPVIPTLVGKNGTPIPFGRRPGISGTLDPITEEYNTPPAHQAGVASLWSKAENIHNPILRVLGEIGAGAGRALDTIGSVAAPRLAADIPGTTANMKANENRQAAQDEQQAAIGEKNAQTQNFKSEADARDNPTPKEGLTPEETTIHDLMSGENGQPRINPDTNKPYSYLEAYQAVNSLKGAHQGNEDKTVVTDKGVMQFNPDTKRYDIPVGAAPVKPGNDFEQFYHDYLSDNKFPDTAHNRLLAREKFAAAGQAPQKPQQQLGVIDGKVVELKPGMTIPDGTQSLSGDLKGKKPTADEQKRADLAENLNENLNTLEDIVNRRPELFGKLAGRLTNLKGELGSDDPDIGALETVKHQLGMVQMSTHGMRSAQGIESAAQSIVNGFKNGPDALKKSIETARKSASTFQQDAGQNPGSTKKGGPSPEGEPPSPADPGMKWQHKTTDGKTEWRQVKQ